jgi:ElaB/YqjD/DUF883 family membrane-anchored ribosome-binding protein
MPIQDIFTRAQWGKSYGPTKGVWYRVSFELAFREEPSVVIIGLARSGRLITRAIAKVTTSKVAAPEKVMAAVVSGIEKISAEKIPKFEIPRIGIGSADDCGKKVANAYTDECKKRLGDWGIFNWMRDAICSVTWGIGYITGVWIHWMYTILVQPQIDQVRDAVNRAISDQVDKINNALSSQVDKINDRLGDLRSNVNEALSSQVDRINDRLSSLVDNINIASSGQIDRVIERVNAVLTDLYASWGLPSGIIATPVHVRNVSTTGFDWQSYGGTTIYWISIGKTRFRLPEIPVP